MELVLTIVVVWVTCWVALEALGWLVCLGWLTKEVWAELQVWWERVRP